MTQIFIFPHFGLNIHHTFLYFVTLKGFVFVIGKLFWLHCSDTTVKINMTKNREIVIFLKKKMWYDIFAISLPCFDCLNNTLKKHLLLFFHSIDIIIAPINVGQ